jgi:DnaJ-class molecular chaperone
MEKKQSYYNILKIQENATFEEIKKAYRLLSLKYHPDKNKNEIDKYKLINEAYDTLKDTDKKQEYDYNLNNTNNINTLFDHKFANNFNKNNFNNININDLLNNPLSMFMFNQNENIFEDILNNTSSLGDNIKIFHNGQSVNFNQIMKPEIIFINVTINFKQSYTGDKIPITFDRYIIKNNIKIYEKEKIYIDIPPGIDNDETIMLSNKGNIDTNNNIGDVKIHINIENDTKFERNGLDLYILKLITLKESLCGFKFELKHINGKSYNINNTLGNIIKPNYKKVIKNMGFKKDDYVGDLIIEFFIDYPEKMDIEIINKLDNIL